MIGKKIGLYAGAMFLIFCVAFIVTRRARSQEEPHKAFTAFQVEKRFDGKGVERYREERIHAVRADGSWAWMAQRPGPDGRLYDMGEIHDLQKRELIEIDGATQSVQTYKLDDTDVASDKAVDHSCRSNAERSIVAGHEVSKVLTPRDGSSSDAVELRAPDLNCFSLHQENTKWGFSAKVEAKTTRETAFVILGEPSPTLFSVPPNYVERSPAQAAAEYERLFGEHSLSNNVLQRAEQGYEKNRKVNK